MEIKSDRLFHVVWSVHEVVDGSGDDLRHGDRRQVAQGEVIRSADSEDAIRAELLAVLKDSFPKHVVGGTYELDRVYEVSIRECSSTFEPSPVTEPGPVTHADTGTYQPPALTPRLHPRRTNPTIIEIDSSPGWMRAVVVLIWINVFLWGAYAALKVGGVIR